MFPVEKIKGLSQKIRQFLMEVKVEMKKVAWPLRKETIASTYVVVILVLLIALYLGLADLGLSSAVKLILT